MARLGLGLPQVAKPEQMDLFDQPPPRGPGADEPKKPQARGFTISEHAPVISEPVTPNTTRTRKPKPTNPWDTIKLSAYGLLVTVELFLTGFAMYSLHDNFPVQIALVVIGVSASILGIYLFLRGGVFGLVAWGVYAVLFVLLNWSWTVGNLVQESQAVEDQGTALQEIASNDLLIQDLTLRVSKLPGWAEKAIESLGKQIDALRARNEAIRSVPKVETMGKNTFDTMGAMFGLSGVDMAKWWWLGALTLLQCFMVLVAPRST